MNSTIIKNFIETVHKMIINEENLSGYIEKLNSTINRIYDELAIGQPKQNFFSKSPKTKKNRALKILLDELFAIART